MAWNTKIPHLRRFVLQNFPFIEEDFDALTDYQLICKVVEFLNKVITSQNEVIQQMINVTADFECLEGLFNQLKDYVDHYFDNLDVQEEINNKLDAMVEDGTLQEIITTYIQSNVAWTFDNVSEMQSATNLIADSYARTLGFYAIGDNGGGIYKIRELAEGETANGMDVITINDNLVAELVGDSVYRPEKYGAKNDGSTDAYAIFDYILSLMDNNDTLELTGTYLISQPLYLPNKNNILIKGGTLKATDSFSGYLLNTSQTSATGISGYTSYGENIKINDVFFDCSYMADGIYMEQFLRIEVNGCTIQNPKTYGVYCNNGHEANITNTNIIGRTYGYDDTTVASTGIVLDTFDSIVDNCVVAYCQWAVEVKRKFNQVINSHFYCNRNSGGNVKLNKCSYIRLTNNYYDGSGVYVIDPWQVEINNSLFEISDATNHIIEIYYDTGSATTRGVYINGSSVDDARTNKPDIEFITANRTPLETSECYIGDIHLPEHIKLSNPYNIFAIQNSVPPMIVPDSFFAATVAADGTMGTHIDPSGYYTYEYNGNYLESTFVGSGYSWLFCKVVVPRRCRVSKYVYETQSGQGNIAIFKTDDTFISYNSATLEPGEYYIGVYRNAKLSFSNM